MKLINNQNSSLISELNKVVLKDSEILIAADYLTVHSLYSVIDSIGECNNIKLLINSFYSYCMYVLRQSCCMLVLLQILAADFVSRIVFISHE